MSDIAALRRLIESGISETAEARRLSERDRDYYDGKQIPETDEAAIRAAKQMPIVSNRIQRKVDAMVGLEQRGRVDPRAYPREPGDEDAAELATRCLQYVEQDQRIDTKRSQAFENLLVEGYGGFEVCVEVKRGRHEIGVKNLRWEEIIHDPHSREKDFSDAAWLGTMKWMARDAAMAWARQFVDPANPDALDLEAAFDTQEVGLAALGQTYEDRPRLAWADRKSRRVRVVQLWHRKDAQWRLTVFTGRAVLFDDVSPYRDADGEPVCPMVLMSAYVDRENRRYGVVRGLIGSQDEVNVRRRMAVKLLTNRQTVGMQGAVESIAALKRELAAPDGHVEINPYVAEAAAAAGMKPFDIIPTGDMASGNLALLQEAKGEIDGMGPNAALMGQVGASASGRAIMAQQQAGTAELAPLYDAKRDCDERLYRLIWAMIRQWWDAPRYIRVTGEQDAVQFLGINQPMTDEFGQRVIDQWGQPVLQNAVAEIDVDIVIDAQPEYATLRAEQFETLAKLAQAGVPIPPKAIVEASDLRDKRKIIEAMDQAMQAQMPPQPPVDPMQQQIAVRGALVEQDAKSAQAERARAGAEKDAAQADAIRAKSAEERQRIAAMAQGEVLAEIAALAAPPRYI